jgi:hypothetical protein
MGGGGGGGGGGTINCHGKQQWTAQLPVHCRRSYRFWTAVVVTACAPRIALQMPLHLLHSSRQIPCFDNAHV